MRFSDKARVIVQLLRWRLSWDKRDTAYLPPGLPSPEFMSARDAAARITDGSVVLSCGLAANARCSIFFWAVRELYEKTGKPAGLTWISVGAQGGRGRVPGTVEELALPGLITRYISGHVETARSLLELAETGEVELHLLPQGEMTRVLDAQGRGEGRVLSKVGLGTFLDPRCGRGSPVREGMNLVRVAGRMLEYRMPPVDFALINAPYADNEGNIYFRNAATLTESIEAARAARRNGGQVLVAVADLIEKVPGEIVLRSDEVDAVVVNPRNEQTGGIPQRKYWRLFTTGAEGDEVAALQMLRYANDRLGLTPFRGPAEQAVARIGASLFVREVSPGATVNLGVGYGEELVRVLSEHALHRDVTFTTETGVYGGVPSPGIYFGSAVYPQKLKSSAWMFRHYLENLDAAVLGFLEVDAQGDVNGSERGGRIVDLVGPGGLPNIVDAARTIIFIGGWMKGAQWRVRGGELRLRKPGQAKFVDRVSAVTFSARQALADGKKVFYVTNVGVFRLTPDGLLLTDVTPGIDVNADIRDACPANILLPPDGGITRIPTAVVTGRNFSLRWANGANET